MSKELIVSYFDNRVNIALLEEGRLMELHEEDDDVSFSVGDLFIGKIKRLSPNLNSCFINIGYNKDAFLHYHDLGPQLLSQKNYITGVFSKKIKTSDLSQFKFQKDIDKNGKIEDVLQPKEDLLVQVTKEPIGTKGPRISSEISIAGRYLVINPFGTKVSISKKISHIAERERLKIILDKIKPKGFGIIVRTVAENKTEEELQADLNYLLSKWEQCFKNLQEKKVPGKVLNEMEKSPSILRDYFNNDFVKIVCDNKDLITEMKEYMEIIAPDKKDIIKYYNSPTPLFEHYNIEKQIKQSFGKHVMIPKSKGAYLVIEHTEALHVIDVNSGTISSKNNTQEKAALEVNLIAAKELARQLRLRDMGGIIVVDFIDMVNLEHRKKLYESLKLEMAQDRAKHKILPPSKFGLIQITRQRVRPEKNFITEEISPNNSGKIEPPVIILEKLEHNIFEILKEKPRKLFLHVHPFIASYLKIGFINIQMKWLFKYKTWISIIERDSFKYLEIKIYDKNKEELYSYNY